MTNRITTSEYASAVTEGARLVWKNIVARSYLDPMTLKYMCIFTPEEMERLSTMTKHNSMRILQSKLEASEMEAKLGNIPYKEAVRLQEENAKMQTSIKQANAFWLSQRKHSHRDKVEFTRDLYDQLKSSLPTL